MPSDIAGLAASILHDPVRVAVSPERPAVELIDQCVAHVEKGDKRAFLAALIEAQEASRALVFTRTKHGADRLVKGLESSGITASAIHANKSQNNRTRTMEGFRSGEIRVLVATDLAARGIDVDGISHVYNYELPDVPETYVHRIGRTARAGAAGVAVALCDSEEKPLLRAIEKILRNTVPLASGPAFDRAREEARVARAAAPAEKDDRGERRAYGRGDSRARAPAYGARGTAKREAAGRSRTGGNVGIRTGKPTPLAARR
jgi:ATP-dependent RNA helicase RhlE